MTENRPPRFKLSARRDERFFAPVRRDLGRARTGFVGLVGLVLAVHVAVFAWLLYRDSTDPVAMAQATEVPVEVVVEPPPPPAPKPPEPKPPESKPPPARKADEAMEKPATSAPRAPPKTPVETKQSKAQTRAPKAAVPPSAGAPKPVATPGTAAERPAAPEVARAAAKTALDDDGRDAEALDRAKTAPGDKPKAAEIAPAAPSLAMDPAKTMADLLDQPSYSFAAALKMAPLPVGTEDDRYLAVVYGMVMRSNPYVGSTASQRGERGTVSVTFIVDPGGTVRSEAIRQSSGFADLDALAITAVRTAAPFPPPPGSGPQQLIATMAFGPP